MSKLVGRPQAEFLLDMRLVSLDGFHAQIQLGRNVGRAATLGEKLQHFPFPMGEGRGLIGCSRELANVVVHDGPGDSGADVNLVRHHGANGPSQLLCRAVF